MATVTINVTADDIRKAKECRRTGDGIASRTCPIAQAVKRQLHRPYVRVSSQSITTSGNWRDSVELPIKVWQFIAAFDDGHKVEPFSFKLNQ